MRRRVVWGAGLAVAVLGLLLGSLTGLARAPREGLFGWDAERGALRVLEPGWHLLPRWQWARSEAATLRGEATLTTDDGFETEAEVAWRPGPGSYRLTPAETPSAALAAGLASAADRLLAGIPLVCIAPESGTAGSCADGWRERAVARVAELLGTQSDRVQLRFEIGARTRRQARLRALGAGLPEPGTRVLLLGLDGLDWELVLPWVEAGRMPNLGRLLRRGTWGDLEPLLPMLSPLIWTTIATGVSPEEHGILDFVERDPSTGELIPVTSRSRRTPALWNIASALGRTVDVVGWWASWPAEEIAGTLVSDRLYYTLVKQGPDSELAADAPGIVSPPGAAPAFVELRRRAVSEVGWEELRTYMPVSREVYERAVEEAGGMEDPVDGFRRILASTRTYLGSGLELAAAEPDLLMVYLEGTDTVGHLLARYVPPPVAAETSPAEAATYAAAVPRYFELVDAWLGRYLERCPLSECTWLIVSDHGFKWGEDRPRGSGERSGRGVTGLTAPLWHDEHAVFLLAGRGVPARGRVGEKGSVYDVAPTVASLLRLPPGSGWRGRPLPGVQPAPGERLDYAELLPPEAIERPRVEQSAAGREFLAQLEALGYLGAAADEAAATDQGGLTLGQLNNLGILQLNEGRLEEAEATLRRAVELFPRHPYTHYNLNLVLIEQGSYEEADRQLWSAVESWSAVEEGWREPSTLIAASATTYLEHGLPGRATALLSHGVRERPRDLALWLELLTVRTRLDQCEPGLEEGRVAAARFPEVPRIHGLYGLFAMCRGEVEEARRAMRRSLELDPNQPVLREALAALP